MKVLLARVGIDSTYGKWNAPIDAATGRFVWVPFPEDHRIQSEPSLATTYEPVVAALKDFARWCGVETSLPSRLHGKYMHLDPDFDHLTYGDISTTSRGRQFTKLQRGDLIAFYAGLAMTDSPGLFYGLIGLLRVSEVVAASEVEQSRFHENAHTRLIDRRPGHVVVRGEPNGSGRLKSAIRIGHYCDRSYRLLPEVRAAWGGFATPSDSIQRGVRWLGSPGQFMRWLETQAPDLEASNWAL